MRIAKTSNQYQGDYLLVSELLLAHGNKNLVRAGKIASGIGLFCLALVNVTQLKLWGLGCGSGYWLEQLFWVL
uniref:Uncharacterized protein n=1 Tax=Salix viminalis TaxID=40686 RepID=A0A6N2LTX4_SALVM